MTILAVGAVGCMGANPNTYDVVDGASDDARSYQPAFAPDAGAQDAQRDAHSADATPDGGRVDSSNGLDAKADSTGDGSMTYDGAHSDGHASPDGGVGPEGSASSDAGTESDGGTTLDDGAVSDSGNLPADGASE